MSYAFAFSGIDESVWEANTAKWGAPVWRSGYWFWDNASIISYLVCLPFGDRSAPCVAWASKDLLPPAKVPPYLEDATVASQISQYDIDQVRVAIINPLLMADGKPALPSGPIDGKLYFGAKLALSKRPAVNYALAKMVAQVIVWAEYNKIEALDPSAADLIPIPGIDALKDMFPTTNPEGGPVPFYQDPMILLAGGAFVFMVMARKKHKKQQALKKKAQEK